MKLQEYLAKVILAEEGDTLTFFDEVETLKELSLLLKCVGLEPVIEGKKLTVTKRRKKTI